MKSKLESSSDEIKELYKRAILVREMAYAPYSAHKVGAALRTQDGKVFTGCNVENASYGGTVCAERVAIQKAVSETGKLQIKEILVITQSSSPWPPCGMCLQVIGEFGKNAKVYCASTDGDIELHDFKDLFPQLFNIEYLKSGAKKS